MIFGLDQGRAKKTKEISRVPPATGSQIWTNTHLDTFSVIYGKAMQIC